MAEIVGMALMLAVACRLYLGAFWLGFAPAATEAMLRVAIAGELAGFAVLAVAAVAAARRAGSAPDHERWSRRAVTVAVTASAAVGLLSLWALHFVVVRYA